MKKWECMEKWTNQTANVVAIANEVGQDGWELVAVLPIFGKGYPILFKREIPEQSAAETLEKYGHQIVDVPEPPAPTARACPPVAKDESDLPWG